MTHCVNKRCASATNIAIPYWACKPACMDAHIVTLKSDIAQLNTELTICEGVRTILQMSSTAAYTPTESGEYDRR